MNLCMSHSSVLRLVDKVGEGHDATVENWKKCLQSELRIPGAEEVSLSLGVWVYLHIIVCTSH